MLNVLIIFVSIASKRQHKGRAIFKGITVKCSFRFGGDTHGVIFPQVFQPQVGKRDI